MKNEISSKLERLREYLKILKGYQSHSLEDLKKDITLRGAVERYLEVSLESCLDIGEMIISKEKARKPETYREVIEILGEIGVLPGDFVDKFTPAAGFRNILVHMYAEIDIEKVHGYLQNNLDDINKFAKFIAKYLKKIS
ncbi:MAG: DUF86 domain-containing protein [Methanobacteriaceae archaeon]|nr:DUF86 domain-containing protein [Methanobacteriaceae archaeon]